MSQLAISFLILLSSSFAFAEVAPKVTCPEKVEAVALSLLKIQGFQDVISCRDAPWETCLDVSKSSDNLNYFAEFTYGSVNYPAYFRFHIMVDSFCQVERVDITQE